MHRTQALINSDEMTRLKELFQRMTLGEDISAEKELAQVNHVVQLNVLEIGVVCRAFC